MVMKKHRKKKSSSSPANDPYDSTRSPEGLAAEESIIPLAGWQRGDGQPHHPPSVARPLFSAGIGIQLTSPFA